MDVSVSLMLENVKLYNSHPVKVLHVLADHGHFVQGLAWDPLFQYLASQSNDRSMIIYRFEKTSPHPRLVNRHSKTLHEKASGKSYQRAER
jgi:chromatin assembly factor 1 subunit B